MITLRTLAEELGMDRSHLHKYVKKIGIETTKIRTRDSGNQPTSAVTEEQAELIRKRRKDDGYQPRQEEGRLRTVTTDEGWFYIVLPDSEMRPGRVKLGFTGDLAARLSEYRTIAPEAKYVAEVECRRTWETAVRDALSNFHNLRSVAGEVFDYEGDVQVLVERLQSVCAMLHGKDVKDAIGLPASLPEVANVT